MGLQVGDLLPYGSGTASIGAEQVNDLGGFTRDIRPFTNVHQLSGVFHHTGNSGVMRFDQEFELSIDGGITFDVLPTSGQIDESIQAFAPETATPSGELSGDTFPTVNIYDGQPFYRTDLNTKFHYYEGYGGKWLGDLEQETQGRNGVQGDGGYLRRINGMICSATLGFYVPYDITIVCVSWAMAAGVLDGAWDIDRSGTTIVTIDADNIAAGADMTLNDDFDSGGIMAAKWDSTGLGLGCTSPQVMVWYRRRAT